MQIAINIPKEIYEEIKTTKSVYRTDAKILCNAIMNGTPLPKGHGDLIDRSNLITTTDIRADGIEFTYVPYSEIEDAPTIIEADISGKENER